MIRSFLVEDKDYITQSHYEIYKREFNYNIEFRDFIERKVDAFIHKNDSKETIWIIEIDGKQKGSIGIVRVNENVAQLGLLLVDPSLRGTGYGKRLVDKAIQFSKEQRYTKIILWTESELKSARHLYEKCGFKIIDTRTQHLSGNDLCEEKWELTIT